MTVLSTPGFADYELLDSGGGFRLERYGAYLLSRPDPQAIWLPHEPSSLWNSAHAVFQKNGTSGGVWKKRENMPEEWKVTYKNLAFSCRLTPFKHTGIFPEQHLHWDWISDRIRTSTRKVSVLNLFGYTGAATLAAADAGAEVTHVDASKSSLTWAHTNAHTSGLDERPIRWILDDALVFSEREQRRGRLYDAVIMDPPVYGHGPNGEVWDFPLSFPKLLSVVSRILVPNPIFILINAYAITASHLMLANTVHDYLPQINSLQTGELAIQEKSSQRLLSTGIFCRAPHQTDLH